MEGEKERDSTDANYPAKLSTVERHAVLEVLKTCADSLVIYQSTLRQQGAARKEPLLRMSLYVSGIIRDLIREISERGTIELLIKEIDGIASRERQERLLTEEEERIRAIVTELRGAIVDKKASDEREEKRLTNELISARDERERLKLIKDTEVRYVRAWERTRREQNMLRHQLRMDQRAETLDDRYVRARNENRVNDQSTRYLTRRIALIENRIEQWQQRYDREKEMYEGQIDKVRNEMEDARKYLKELTTEYRSNQEFIDSFVAQQEALRRQKEHEDHVQRSAVGIQAWWRGIMVRRKLGPYRPEERKKKRTVKTKK